MSSWRAFRSSASFGLNSRLNPTPTGKQGLESTYGAAASIVVVLILVYYISHMILMGAEVTHSYAKHNDSLKRRDPTRGRETCDRCRSPDLRGTASDGRRRGPAN